MTSASNLSPVPYNLTFPSTHYHSRLIIRLLYHMSQMTLIFRIQDLITKKQPRKRRAVHFNVHAFRNLYLRHRDGTNLLGGFLRIVSVCLTAHNFQCVRHVYKKDITIFEDSAKLKLSEKDLKRKISLGERKKFLYNSFQPVFRLKHQNQN